MQEMQRKLLSLLGGTSSLGSTKATKVNPLDPSVSRLAELETGKVANTSIDQASPELSTQPPSLHCTTEHQTGETVYADVQTTPTKASYRALLESAHNHQTLASSSQNTLPNSRRSPSHAFSLSNRPTLSNRSLWDPDDDELDPNVYKDV